MLMKDLQIYRDWLNRSLATYPDQDVAKNIELIVDGYDVVDKREYPPPGRMSSSASDGYDILMLTGSSAYKGKCPIKTSLRRRTHRSRHLESVHSPAD